VAEPGGDPTGGVTPGGEAELLHLNKELKSSGTQEM
jgi:hypothetical protein